MFSLVFIDDEAFVLDLYAKITDYKHFGFDMTKFFSNSNEAYEYIKNNRVDLIITDIDMMGINGIDIGKYCRKYFPNIVVAFISAYQKFDFALEALNNNISNYLVKPVTKEQIEDLLKTSYVEIASKRYFDDKLENDEIDYIKQIVTELFCGVLQTEHDYYSSLSKYSIDDFLNSKFAFYKLSIAGLSSYINTKWKFDILRLQHAIYFMLNSIIAVEGLEFIPIRISLNELVFVVLNITDSDFLYEKISEAKQHLDKYFEHSFEFEEIFSFDNIKAYFTKNNSLTFDRNSILKMVDEYIKNNYTRKISLDDISGHVSLSKRYFCTYYKKYKGETFLETLTNYRIEQAKILLKDRNIKTSLIYKYVGFSNANYFYKEFKIKTGMTPAEYQLKNGN